MENQNQTKHSAFLRLFRLTTVSLLSVFFFGELWGYFSVPSNVLQTNTFNNGAAQKLIVSPPKAALFAGEKQEFTAQGIFPFGEYPMPVSWRIEPQDIGILHCNTSTALACVFQAGASDVSRVGKIIAQNENFLHIIPVKILPENGTFSLFADVLPTDWYFNALYYLLQYPQVLEHFTSKEFRADTPLSRIEWITLFNTLLSEKGLLKRTRQKTICRDLFADIPFQSDVSETLCSFLSEGWVSGYMKNGKRYFNPEQAISRQEAASIVCKALCDEFENVFNILNKNYNSFYFSDLNPKNPFSKNLISLGLYGMFEELSNHTLEPEKALTRGEGVVLLQRLFVFFDQKFHSQENQDDKKQMKVIDILHSGIKKNKQPLNPVLTSMTPQIGDETSEIAFRGENLNGKRKAILAHYYGFDANYALQSQGIAAFSPITRPGENEVETELLLSTFVPYAQLVDFKVTQDGNLSNSMTFQVVARNAPRIFEMTPQEGVEQEPFVIHGEQLGNQENSDLEGIIFRKNQESEEFEVVEKFVQELFDLWTDDEIWFSSLATKNLQTGDEIVFWIIRSNEDNADSPLKSNIVRYRINLEAKALLYALSQNVIDPTFPLEIYGRNFGQLPDQTTINGLSFTCIQRNLNDEIAISSGLVPLEKIEVWEDGYIRLSDVTEICPKSTVGDSIEFRIELSDKISNSIKLFLYNTESPQPIINSIIPESGNGNHEIILQGSNFGQEGEVKISFIDEENNDIVPGKNVDYSLWSDDRIILPSLPVDGNTVLIDIVTRGYKSNTARFKVLKDN